jgi:hypothetical protein
MKTLLVVTAILAAFLPSVVVAQHGMPGGTPMTFFVTSEPIGDGGNLGGLPGSQPDGRAFNGAADHTCNNWTSNAAGSAQVGHSDRVGNGNQSWNSSHDTTGCSQKDLVSWGGVGLFYCFAAE